MSDSVAVPRKLIILAIVLPIAALVGYQLADPDFASYALVGALLAVLSIPVFLRWHHPLLVFSWNAALEVFFLPGQPHLWMLLSGISLVIVFLNRLILKRETQTYVPSVVWPLIFLTLVVLATAKLTGGVGLRVLGSSSYGGRRYVYFMAAVIGYFALTGQRIPPSKAGLYTGLFFLSAITFVMGHVVYELGPSFWFLFRVFPVGDAQYQAIGEFSGYGLVRLAGFTFAGVGIAEFMLCRFGVRGLLNMEKPWRLVGFLAAVFMALLGGFRSGLLTIGLLCVFHFFLEGLHRTRLGAAAALGLILGYSVLAVTAGKLPLSVQRAVAFLPIEVNPVARRDALASTEWRVNMWKVLWPDVPKYLLLGKGSSASPNDLYLASQAMRRGHAEQFESALQAGDYHSAPLTLIIQFGIWGVIGMVWFCIASLCYLYNKFRDSPPELKLCNTFLLAYFAVNVVFFCTIMGSFADNFYLFTGTIGLSVSLNGHARSRSSVLQADEIPLPASRHRVGLPAV